MTKLTMNPPHGLAGDRSVSAPAETRREPASPWGGGLAADPQVSATAKRRNHTGEYKLKILAEIDANPGKTGIILRREGLYSSYLKKWRQWRNEMSKTPKTTSANKQLHNEMAKLKRENLSLKMKLQKAERLIELQKKTSELLKMMSQNEINETQ